MATWTSISINHSDLDRVISQIKELTGITNIDQGNYPTDFHDSYLLKRVVPNYLVIGKVQNDWVTIRFNSFAKLEDWGISISNNLSCKVIIILAQSVSDSYYFALYDNGHKLREIEVGQDEQKQIDIGEHYDFENENIGKPTIYDDEVHYFFDFECIEEYCNRFGLTIQSDDYHTINWTILKGEQNQETVAGLIKSLSRHQEKPWWKFW